MRPPFDLVIGIHVVVVPISVVAEVLSYAKGTIRRTACGEVATTCVTKIGDVETDNVSSVAVHADEYSTVDGEVLINGAFENTNVELTTGDDGFGV